MKNYYRFIKSLFLLSLTCARTSSSKSLAPEPPLKKWSLVDDDDTFVADMMWHGATEKPSTTVMEMAVATAAAAIMAVQEVFIILVNIATTYYYCGSTSSSIVIVLCLNYALRCMQYRRRPSWLSACWCWCCVGVGVWQLLFSSRHYLRHVLRHLLMTSWCRLYVITTSLFSCFLRTCQSRLSRGEAGLGVKYLAIMDTVKW